MILTCLNLIKILKKNAVSIENKRFLNFLVTFQATRTIDLSASGLVFMETASDHQSSG